MKNVNWSNSYIKVYIMLWCICMSKSGMAEKYRGILYIFQCKKKKLNEYVWSNSLYNKKNYDYLEDKQK